jgi:hypothetical protein
MRVNNAIEGKQVRVKHGFWPDEAHELVTGDIGRVWRLYWADDSDLVVDFQRAGRVYITETDWPNLELAPGEVEA